MLLGISAAGCSVQKKLISGGALLDAATHYSSTRAGDAAMIQPYQPVHDLSSKAIAPSTVAINDGMSTQSRKSSALNSTVFSADTTVQDTAKTEPKLQPLIPAGAGIFAAGIAATAVSVLSGGLSIFIGIGAFVLGLLLTNWGYKKVKAEPEKWKGEKLALAVYYALIPVGLFLMFYPVYLLFTV